MVLVLGSAVFRFRHWTEAFYGLACMEAVRRGLADRKLSAEEQHAVAVMTGPEPTAPEGPGSPFAWLGLRTFSVLSGQKDIKELAAHIAERRATLCEAMLERQARRVERFRTVRWASRAWVVQGRLSRLEVAARGALWLLPKALNEITVIVKEHSTRFGVAAFFLGSAYWLLARDKNGSGASAPDVLGFLGKLVLPGLVLWAMGVLLFRIVVARFGPARG